MVGVFHGNVCAQIINKPKEGEAEMSEEERQKKMLTFIDKYEDRIKQFGMYEEYGARCV